MVKKIKVLVPPQQLHASSFVRELFPNIVIEAKQHKQGYVSKKEQIIAALEKLGYGYKLLVEFFKTAEKKYELFIHEKECELVA